MAESIENQAKALYDEGKVGEAIEAVTKAVKASPSEIKLRTFLFELLCFAGEWQRADKQLDVIGHQGVSAEIGVQVYRNCVKAEIDRKSLMSRGLAPHFLSEPPSYVDLHLEAINRIREGDLAKASETLLKAEEERPAMSGTIGDKAFEDFRDMDDIFGPVVELIVQDKYTWLPLEQTLEIAVDQPKQLRDLVWSPASIRTVDREMRAFIPNLYINSSDESDDQLKLGRMTSWNEIADGVYRGVGLRTFAVDGEELPILGLRSLTFNNSKTETAAS